MRDLRFAREQAFGDRLAHAREGDGLFFAGDAARGTDGRGRGNGAAAGCTGGRLLDVALEDASARAGARDGGKVHAAGCGDLAGQRGGLDAAGRCRGGRLVGAGCWRLDRVVEGLEGVGLRLRLFGRRCGRGGVGAVRGFPLGEDEGDLVADFDDGTFRGEQLGERPVVE